MYPNRYTGIFPALFTPFRADGVIDEHATEALIEMHLRSGVSGFYVGGISGEVFLMSAEERMLALRLCADIVGGRATLIAQVGDVSEEKALRLAVYARRCCYDAVSAVVPLYYKFGFENIKEYYHNIAAAAELPMFIHYIAAMQSENFNLNQILELVLPDYIAGIRYTSNDLYIFERIRAAFSNKAVMFGMDEALMAGLALGADGAIGTAYNFMPDKAVGVMTAIKTRELAEARRLQGEINTVLTCLHEVGLFEGAKALLDMMGLDIGRCRRPFGTVSEEHLRLLREQALPLMKPLRG